MYRLRASCQLNSSFSTAIACAPVLYIAPSRNLPTVMQLRLPQPFEPLAAVYQTEGLAPLHRAAFSASPGKPAGYQCLLGSPHLFFALAQCLQVGSAQATCASVEVNAPCHCRHLARMQTQNTWHIAACAAMRADPSPGKCLGTSMSIKQLMLTTGWNIADMQAHSALVP